MARFESLRVKSVINRLKYRDNWFWNRYSINPYRGCQFACNYCDAITEKYLVHPNFEDFSRVIYIKEEAPELLRRQIERLDPDVVALSGVTDPYQPAEHKYGLTREILQILKDHGFGVHIGTKSDLVLRDLDLLSKISQNSWCAVSFTIITFDQELLSLLEPWAPPPEQRLEALQRVAEAGILAGVNFIPIVPYLADSRENIQEVVERSFRNGARYLLPGVGMTLRDNQKVRFLRLLAEHRPKLIPRYEGLYRNSQTPDREYTRRMSEEVWGVCRELGLPIGLLPPVLDRPLRENWEVANLLLLVAYFRELKEGASRATWAYHRAAENIEKLGESIREIHRWGEIKGIPGVGKGLAGLIAEFLETGRCRKLEELRLEPITSI